MNMHLPLAPTMEDRVARWMGERPHLMLPHVRVNAAAGFARLKKAHHLMVLHRRRVVGIISRDHLLDAEGWLTVGEVMRRDPPVLSPIDTIERAAAMMTDGNFYCLPVVSNGQVVGVLTLADVVRAFRVRTDSRPQAGSSTTWEDLHRSLAESCGCHDGISFAQDGPVLNMRSSHEEDNVRRDARHIDPGTNAT